MRVLKLVYKSEVLDLLVDDEDFDRIAILPWNIKNSHNTKYAHTWFYDTSPRRRVMLHRHILGEPDSWIDHIDGNGLNNQKENLRLCNPIQNARNARKVAKATSCYKGVWADRNKWRSQIMVNGTRLPLGTYNSEEHAALAYNEKAKELFGEFAVLNEVAMVPDYPGITKHQSRYNRKYHGVYYDKGTQRSNKVWRVKIKIEGKWKSFGRYTTEVEAALAYNEAALKNFGNFAVLN